MNKLKQCPFCGRNDILLFNEDENEETCGSTYIALCRSCGTRGGLDYVGQGYETAVAVWNRREQESEWISVKDMLPEIDVEVLLCSDGKVTHGSLFYIFGNKKTFVAHAMEVPRVTYWMPLPQPPKGVC